jgi:hypothetical protein
MQVDKMLTKNSEQGSDGDDSKRSIVPQSSSSTVSYAYILRLLLNFMMYVRAFHIVVCIFKKN